MTHLIIFNSTVNKMSSFSDTDVSLWIESNASIVQDSADYGNIANKWHRLAGDSILYALGNSLAANYSTKVDKTPNSVLIVSGTYHN